MVVTPCANTCTLVPARSCTQKAHAKSAAAFTIGVVGRCLSKSVVEGKALQPDCKHLVMAAAPKDVRTYYDSPEASNALIQTVRARVCMCFSGGVRFSRRVRPRVCACAQKGLCRGVCVEVCVCVCMCAWRITCQRPPMPSSGL